MAVREQLQFAKSARRSRTSSARLGVDLIADDAGARVGAEFCSWNIFAALPHGRSILQPALVPELIETPINFEARSGANIALENLSIIANCLDDLDSEVIIEAKALPEIALHT